jgi:hypothetical protein
MNTTVWSVTTFAVLLAGGLSAAEKQLKMADLPPGVQKAVQEQSKGTTIRGLSKEVENGKTFYEAELRVSGHNKDLLIDPAGSIVEIEEEVALDSLPAAVKGGLEKQAAGAKIVVVESVTKGNAVVAYEARIKTAGKTSEIRVTPDGAPAKEP